LPPEAAVCIVPSEAIGTVPPEAAELVPLEAALPDPLILAFDTSAAHCAAVVLQGNRLLAARTEAMEKGQAERLMPMLAEVLAEAGVAPGALCAIAVGTGPGNFTGVRIAVAAARGLALALGVPAIGVTAFDAAAFEGPRPMQVLLDARRGEVHGRTFGLSGPGDAFIARADDLAVDDVPVAGSGAHLAGVTPLAPRWPLAEAIARLALTRLGTPQPRPAPFYLRGADAAPPSDPPPVWLS